MQAMTMRMVEYVKWARVTQRPGPEGRSDARNDHGIGPERGPGTPGQSRTAERGSALRGRCPWELGCSSDASRQPRDRKRGRRADDRGDAGERRGVRRRPIARQHLAERTFVQVGGTARRGGARFDVCAGRLLALALEPDVRMQRDGGQRELQHGPEKRERSHRRMATHDENVGVAWPLSNAGIEPPKPETCADA